MEDEHRKLFQAHFHARDAGDLIHEVIVSCHAASRHADKREKFAPVVQELSNARDFLDMALRAASKARSELIRQTGCNGACRGAPPDAEANDEEAESTEKV